jgi:hypothetical protein
MTAPITTYESGKCATIATVAVADASNLQSFSPLVQEDEVRAQAWLAFIQKIIIRPLSGVLDRCRIKPEALSHCLGRAVKLPKLRPKVQSNPSQIALVVTSIARTIRTLATVGRANRRQLQGCGTSISRAHGLAIF